MKQQFLSKQILLNCSTAFAFASVGRDISPPSRSKECAPSVAPFIDWLRLPEPSGTTPLSLQLYLAHLVRSRDPLASKLELENYRLTITRAMFLLDIVPIGKIFSHLFWKLIPTKNDKSIGELIVGGSQLMSGYINTNFKFLRN